MDVIVLLSDDDVEDAAPAAAAPAAPPAPAPALLSRKKRRLELVQPEPAVPAGAAAGAAAGASGVEDDVIDLTADEDAFASAWRDFEVVDLSGDDEALPPAAAQRDAKPPRPPPEDVLSRQRAKIRSFLRQKGASLRVEACEANPHAAPGTPLYCRFAAALRRCSDKRVQLVFHGTAEANIDVRLCSRYRRNLPRGAGPTAPRRAGHGPWRCARASSGLGSRGPAVCVRLRAVADAILPRCDVRILWEGRHDQLRLLPRRQEDACLCCSQRPLRHHR
jgi:hypothetical protein